MTKLKISFLLAAFFTLNAHATDFKISTNSSGEIFLKGPQCNELLKQKEELARWNTSSPPLVSGCQNTSESFSVSLNQVLPSFVSNLHQKKLYAAGPNCWGTALYFKAMSPVPRFVYPQEMLFWLQSPLCQKLDQGEALQTGDIINVFAPEYLVTDEEYVENDAGTDFWKALFFNRFTQARRNSNGSHYTGYHTLFHSVTVASSALVFGKDSQLAEDRFYLHLLSEMYGRPRDEEFCKENQSIEPHLREYQKDPLNIKAEKCPYFTNAYRCQNFNQYFKNQNLSIEQKDLLHKIESLKKKQEILFSYVTKMNFSISQSMKNLYAEEANQNSQQALRQLKTHPLDKNLEMLLTLQYFSAEAIKTSLQQISKK